MSQSTKTLGMRGEALAAKYLSSRGYRICEQNYRVRIGELDIIAMKQDVIVFVEVKTRKSLHCGFPAESVKRCIVKETKTNQKKIIKTAQFFLRQRHLEGCPCRFDVIEVYVRPERTWEVRHIQGAFEV